MTMASLSKMLTTTLLLMILSPAADNGTTATAAGVEAAATWCVARSDASQPGLQTALDYACGVGATDCAPVQPSGPCYLPNTVQSHASYAFNSYYQRKGANAPDNCDFGGTATASKTDPSYGSCVYPSSPSTAGGTGSTTTTNPSSNAPTPPGTTVVPPLYGSRGLTPGLMPLGPVGANTNTSKAACMEYSVSTVLFISVSSFLVLSFMYQQPM